MDEEKRLIIKVEVNDSLEKNTRNKRSVKSVRNRTSVKKSVVKMSSLFIDNTFHYQAAVKKLLEREILRVSSWIRIPFPANSLIESEFFSKIISSIGTIEFL